MPAWSFDSTYEGLKLESARLSGATYDRFDSTYEGLKLRSGFVSVLH